MGSREVYSVAVPFERRSILRPLWFCETFCFCLGVQFQVYGIDSIETLRVIERPEADTCLIFQQSFTKPMMRFIPCFLGLLASLSPTLAQSSQDTASVSAEYANDETFQNTVLDATNLYRRQHNASILAWNDTLAEYAKDWSENCEFEHSGGPSGENLASGYPNVTVSIEAWGSERDEYDFEKGEFSYGNPAHQSHRCKLVCAV